MSHSSLQRRRDLRRNSTDAERLLWRRLCNRQLAGAKFRRQHPYGPYTLDFYSVEHQLAIEVDGGQHWDGSYAERDEARTRYLEGDGVRVLRFTNLQVLRETEGVAEAIALTLALSQRERGSVDDSPVPLPGGEGRVRGYSVAERPR